MRAPMYILIIAGIFILSFLYLYLHSVTIQLTLRLDEKQKELSSIDDEVEELRVGIARLLSYPRIEEVALQIGFRYPSAKEIIVIYDIDSTVVDSQSFDSL